MATDHGDAKDGLDPAHDPVDLEPGTLDVRAGLRRQLDLHPALA